MKMIMILVAYLLPLTLSASDASVPEKSFSNREPVSLNFVVVEASSATFLVEMVTTDRGKIAQFIRHAVINKPSGWKRGDNPFSDVNRDGKRNIKDVFPWLIIDESSGAYEQRPLPSKDPVWWGAYTIIEYVAKA